MFISFIISRDGFTAEKEQYIKRTISVTSFQLARRIRHKITKKKKNQKNTNKIEKIKKSRIQFSKSYTIFEVLYPSKVRGYVSEFVRFSDLRTYYELFPHSH